MTQQFAYNYNGTLYLMDREIFDLLRPEREKAKRLGQGEYKRLGVVPWMQFEDTLTADQRSRVIKIQIPEEGGVQELR